MTSPLGGTFPKHPHQTRFIKNKEMNTRNRRYKKGYREALWTQTTKKRLGLKQ